MLYIQCTLTVYCKKNIQDLLICMRKLFLIPTLPKLCQMRCNMQQFIMFCALKFKRWRNCCENLFSQKAQNDNCLTLKRIQGANASKTCQLVLPVSYCMYCVNKLLSLIMNWVFVANTSFKGKYLHNVTRMFFFN